jgi:hypothetical protein
MQISVTIENHCIETASKRLYEKLMGRYFKKDVSEEERVEVESRMEALLFFLEQADFGVLRHQYPELNGLVKNQVILDIDLQGATVRICSQDRILPVPLKVGPMGN